jgi:hypothetical protein
LDERSDEESEFSLDFKKEPNAFPNISAIKSENGLG